MKGTNTDFSWVLVGQKERLVMIKAIRDLRKNKPKIIPTVTAIWKEAKKYNEKLSRSHAGTRGLIPLSKKGFVKCLNSERNRDRIYVLTKKGERFFKWLGKGFKLE